MKTLYESILDIDDNEKNFDKNIKDQIKQFLKDNYKYYSNYKISKNPNSDGKYEVSSKGSVEVKNEKITSLTNGLFVWSEVSVSFDCSNCSSLETLKGAPEKVGGSFICSYCDSLTSIEGAPKEVCGYFICYNCDSLKTLEGAPKKVGGDFNCSGCDSLTSLKGAPKEVGKGFYCYGCGKQFTEEDIKKISDVKGAIYC